MMLLITEPFLKLNMIGFRITGETHPWVYLGGRLQRSLLEAGRASLKANIIIP